MCRMWTEPAGHLPWEHDLLDEVLPDCPVGELALGDARLCPGAAVTPVLLEIHRGNSSGLILLVFFRGPKALAFKDTVKFESCQILSRGHVFQREDKFRKVMRPTLWGGLKLYQRFPEEGIRNLFRRQWHC